MPDPHAGCPLFIVQVLHIACPLCRSFPVRCLPLFLLLILPFSCALCHSMWSHADALLSVYTQPHTATFPCHSAAALLHSVWMSACSHTYHSSHSIPFNKVCPLFVILSRTLSTPRLSSSSLIPCPSYLHRLHSRPLALSSRPHSPCPLCTSISSSAGVLLRSCHSLAAG